MAKTKGRLATLEVSTDGGSTFTTVGCGRDITVNLETSEINSTCRDDGAWEAYLPNRNSGSVDLNVLWDESNSGLSTVKDAWLAQTEYDYRFRFQTSAGLLEYEFAAFVTNFTWNAPSDDIANVDLTLRINGQVTEGTQT